MAGNTTLKDPVADKAKKTQEKQIDDELKSFDISNLKMEDFKPLEQRAAKSPHPFDGYPRKMVKVGELKSTTGKSTKDIMMPAYAIMALNPKEVVFKDPSGNRQTVETLDENGKKTGKHKIVNIHAPHNRCIKDYENGGFNTDVCFDRSIKLADGNVLERVAFVESHSVRAQIMFKLDQKGDKIQIDNRYLLLDTKQSNRLRRVFEMIVNPKINKERLARAISGESTEDLDQVAAETPE